VRAVAALYSPRTGVVDIVALLQSLFRACGEPVDAVFRSEVVAVERRANGWRLTARDAAGREEQVWAAHVVNAAGLDADDVAALAGFDVDAIGYRQSFVKGSYFRLRAAKSSLVHHLIYPVPPPTLGGLGVHVTLELDGTVRLGPDIEPIPRARDYCVDEAKAESFVIAASRYLGGISASDLSPDQAGIRPKLRAVAGGVADFLIREEAPPATRVGSTSSGSNRPV
jgi:L-2-hydroxyglutarate oxidase LhgO